METTDWGNKNQRESVQATTGFLSNVGQITSALHL